MAAPLPTNQISSENIYSNDATAASVLTGIYIALNSNSLLPTLTKNSTINSISLVAGLSADELTLFGGAANSNAALTEYYLNKLVSGSSQSPPTNIWSNAYSELYVVNIALERLALSTSLTPAVKQQLTGEAKFLRGFFYFYLVNLYGDLPLSTSSDYSVNAALSRTARANVYRQIITDLREAESLLSSNFVTADAMTPTSERTRPNKSAAAALLARAYLYTGVYDSTEAAASRVIGNGTLFGLDSLNGVFLKNSREAIWQWQPVNPGWNTEDARVFILPPKGPTLSDFPVYLSPQLLGSFEPGDRRRLKWVDSATDGSAFFYYPYKYKNSALKDLKDTVREYTMVLRLGEQYLIRAEARARQNNIGGAQADLNAIRGRAGLPVTGANDQNSLLVAIGQERQVELFTEWGHRWMDLKRTQTVNAVMSAVAPAKGTNWDEHWQYYPIPLYDITQDPHLAQNMGY